MPSLTVNINISRNEKNENQQEKAPINRFEGEGVDFKAKLIGHEEVTEPRGDKICVDTMNKLKFIAQQNLRGSGIHKQRIILNINLNGLQILEEKSRAVLHQHHVHRISFISRDPNDARAFGYIYGKDDGKHEFFGIKTMQAADQVVVALKDLFQVVYELKKKEVEGDTGEITESNTEGEATAITNKTEEESRGASGTADSSEKPDGKKEDNLLDMFGGLGLNKESLTSAPEPWNTPTPQSNSSAHPAFPVSFEDDQQQRTKQQTQQPQQPQQQTQQSQQVDEGLPTFRNPPPFEDLSENSGGSTLAFKPIDLPAFNDPFKTTSPPVPTNGTGISSQPIFSASNESAFNAFPATTTNNSMIGSMNTTNTMPFNSNPASGNMSNMNNFGFGNAPAFGGPPAFNNTSFMQMNNHQPFPVQPSGPPPVPHRNTTQPENVLQPTVGAISDPFSSLDPLGKPEKTMFKKNSPSINDMQTSTAPLAQNSNPFA